MADFENYTVDGRELVRVTSILGIIAKPALIYWYGKNGTAFCKKVMNDTAKFGTEMHEYIEQYNKTGLDPEIENPKHRNLFQKFKTWAEQNDFQCVESELQVHHLDLGYAGTLDSLAYVNGKLEIVDYKTSKDFYETYQLQLMAYKLALKHMGLYGDQELGRRVIRLGRDDGQLETVEYTDDSGDEEAWISAVRLHRWNKLAKDFLTNRTAKAA